MNGNKLVLRASASVRTFITWSGFTICGSDLAENSVGEGVPLFHIKLLAGLEGTAAPKTGLGSGETLGGFALQVGVPGTWLWLTSWLELNWIGVVLNNLGGMDTHVWEKEI